MNVHEFVLPLKSVAVSVTVIAPVPDTVVPDTGDCVTTTDAAGVQLSFFVASVV